MAILDKHFNNVLIGNNFLSCILGLGLLKAHKKILLIDDERLHYGPMYARNFGELEKNFLEVLGADEGLEPLRDLKNYLTPAPLRFCVDGRQLLLGQRPWQNLVELNRKLPELFGDEGVEFCEQILADDQQAALFDQMFFSTCTRVATSAVRVDGVEQLNFHLFLNQCPEKMKQLFASFKSQALNKNLVGQFYLWRSYYQQQMGAALDDVEMFHLFFSLLAPRYQLDEQTLNNQLLKLCQQYGGQFKATSVREWKFHKSAPWCIELASFDGIIHPEHLSFFGSGFEKTPFRLDKMPERYRGLSLTWKLQSKELGRLAGQSILGTQLKDLATDSPWWMAQFYEDRVELLIPVADEPGSKTPFLLKSLRPKIQEWLAPWLGECVFSLGDESVELGAEIWASGPKRSTGKAGVLVDVTRPGQKTLLKNVHYYGPLNKRPMGLFSGLVAVKEAKNFA